MTNRRKGTRKKEDKGSIYGGNGEILKTPFSLS